MKQSTIKDLRTTVIVLLVSILSSASAIYILPTVIAPVHAGFSSPAVTTNPTTVTVGNAFQVLVNVPLGQSVTSICVNFYDAPTAPHPLGKLRGSPCYTIASPSPFTVSSTTVVTATTPMIAWPSQAVCAGPPLARRTLVRTRFQRPSP